MYAGETENRNMRTLQRHAPDGAGDEDGKFSAISFVVFCYFHQGSAITKYGLR